MTLLETWELLSYVVTVVGLPAAIVAFVLEQRKERQNEEEEIFQRPLGRIPEFLKLVLDNATCTCSRREGARITLTEEQAERPAGHLRHPHLAVRTRLPARLREAHAQAHPGACGGRGRTTSRVGAPRRFPGCPALPLEGEMRSSHTTSASSSGRNRARLIGATGRQFGA